jgi:hypothetical protein
MDFAYNLTNNPHKTQIYGSAGAYTYNFPKGITMVYILCMGAGGGGGGGFTRTASPAQAGGGGGGGGVAALTRVVIPKIFLSDSLIISVGTGGAGGTAGLAGTAGGQSIVSTNLGGTVTLNNLYIAQANGGGGAGGGSLTAGGTAGAQGGGSTNTAMGMVSLGTFTNRIGIIGDVGGFPTVTNLLYGGGTIPFSNGRAGGGINAVNPGTAQSGSGITGRGFVPDFAGGTAGTSAAGGNGPDGMFMMNPFVSLGGCGGGSSNSSTGGNGGKGGPGTGGGGGGAGTSPSTGGTGGRGGDGLVIITCW